MGAQRVRVAARRGRPVAARRARPAAARRVAEALVGARPARVAAAPAGAGGGTGGGAAGTGGGGAAGTGAGGAPAACTAMWTGDAKRPQLTDASAACYTIDRYLAQAGTIGALTTDNWNPTAGCRRRPA